MRLCAAMLMLVALVGCDKSSDITLLDSTTSSTIQSTGLVEGSWELCEFPGVIIPDSPQQLGTLAGVAFRFIGSAGLSYSDGLWMAVGGPSPLDGAQIWSSSDGRVWEPRYFPEFGEANPVGVAAFGDGSWVVVTSRSAAFVGGELEFWTSIDGTLWKPAESVPDLQPGVNPTSFASVGTSMAVLFNTEGGDGGESPSQALLVSTDSGVNWTWIPLEGNPRVVVELDGDLIVVGTRLSKPTMWRMSQFWAPQPIEGLGSVTELVSIVEMPDGSMLATGRGSYLDVTYSWFSTSDLENWTRVDPPASVVSASSLRQIGPYAIAIGRTNNAIRMWVTLDGTSWTQMLPEDTPLAAQWLPIEGSLFATDGFVIVGLTSLGLVAGAPIDYQTPHRIGSWETILELSDERTIWGSGAERYVVAGGKINRIEGGQMIEVSQPPVVLVDDATLYPTESAVFVVNGSESWVLIDDEWVRSELPVFADSSEVVETGSGFALMALDRDEVVRYVSTDGIKWSKSTVEPMIGDSISYDPSGWFVVFEETDYRSFSEAMASPVHTTLDGFSWTSQTLGEWLATSQDRVRSNQDGTVTVSTAYGTSEYLVPRDTVFHSLVWADEESTLMRVISEGKPYLVLSAASGEETWIPLTPDGPNLLSVWAYGSEVVGVVLESDREGGLTTVLRVWNPG